MLNEERVSFLVGLCQRMIQCPSLSGQEGDLASLIQETMISLGYDEVDVYKRQVLPKKSAMP